MSGIFNERARANVDAVKRAMDAAQAQRDLRPLSFAQEHAERSILDGNPFRDLVFDLSQMQDAAGSFADPKPIPLGFSGQKLIVRRQGSDPGARLLLRGGGDLRQLYPGCEVVGPLTGHELLYPDDGCPLRGSVRITIVAIDRADFVEPQGPLQPATAVTLLGTDTMGSDVNGNPVKIVAGVLQGWSQAPLTMGAVGYWQPRGFTKVRVTLAITPQPDATDVTITPWWSQDGLTWYKQTSAKQFIPAANDAGSEGMVTVMDIACPNGYMYLQTDYAPEIALTVEGLS
jgi:hypothetical protein